MIKRRRKPENLSNIQLLCPECAKNSNPDKGKYTAGMLRQAKIVKKAFQSKDGMVEHMWVKIKKITEDGVEGTVFNDAVYPGMPKYGSHVFVKFEEIEDSQ